MKLIIFFGIICLQSIQIINCKKFRVYANDELMEYEVNKDVETYKEWCSLNNLVLEHIDDDNILIDGHVDVLKGFDHNIPMQVVVLTQSLQQSVWVDQTMKLSMQDGCKEFLNKDRFWYNFTKLWTADVCPPKKGTKMAIETQNCTALLDLPDNVPNGSWRAFILVTQITPMGKNEFGFGLTAELVPL